MASVEMASEEKSTWIHLGVAIAGYGTYLGLVLSQAGPIAEREYQWPMLWTILGAILASIVLHALLGVYTGRNSRKDERDRAIGRYGELGGQAFVVIGALAALVLSWVQADHFWIGNAVYVCFALSAVLSTVLKIVAYRQGLPQ